MKFFLFLCLISSCFLSCKQKEKVLPKDILPVDSMKKIVWHLMEAGEYAGYRQQKDSTIKKFTTVYFSEVLQLHHLDKNTFVKSFNFYQSNPYFNDILFDSVNAYGARQRVDMYKKRQ